MCLSGISFGRYCRKSLAKAVGLQKRQKGVDGDIERLVEGSNLLRTMFENYTRF